MAKEIRIMTISSLRKLLDKLDKELGGEFYEIHLSCDEEGNNFSPMAEDTSISLAIDRKLKQVFFYPLH